MKCEQAGVAILEADRQELAGQGEGPLAAHIRECSRCRAVAQAVMKSQDALGAALIDQVPPPDVDAILDRARSAEAGRPLHWFRRFRTAGLTLVPLAAAAALATLFLSSEPDLPAEPFLAQAEPSGLDLQAPEDARVAILPTKNPDITVLWFF